MIGDIARISDRQLESTLPLGDGQPDMDELGAAEEAHKADVVSPDLRPVDPVRDAAHTKAEVPAIDDERDSNIDGHAAAMSTTCANRASKGGVGGLGNTRPSESVSN